MLNNIGFVISEEDLALGSGTRLDYSELLCGRSFITVKMDRESFWHRHQKSYQGLMYFDQTHSHKIHLKLTRSELTIERSYQTHSHNVCLKVTFGNNSANEKAWIICLLQPSTLPFPLFKRVILIFPWSWRDSQVAHHDCRPQIAILSWSNINSFFC